MSDNRIILSRADFSANNIGRYVELSDFTKKVLSKQTQYSEDSAEAIALDTFLNQLTQGGFIGGEEPLLLQLMIPALAGSHSELLYDIAQLDNDGYPTNMMSEGELGETDETKQVYNRHVGTSGGVYVKRYSNYSTMGSDTATYQARANIDNTTFKSQNSVHNADQNSFSMVGCIAVPHTPTSTSVTDRYLGDFTGSWHVKPNVVANISGATPICGASYPEIKRSFIINYNKENTRFEGMIDGVSFTGETMSPIKYKTPAQSPNWTKLWIGDFSYSIFTFMSLIALGNYIPSDKQTELKGYMDTFLTAVHIPMNVD